VEIERVDFLSIASQDIERSRRFYLEALGLPLDRDVPGSGGFEDPDRNALMLHRRYAP